MVENEDTSPTFSDLAPPGTGRTDCQIQPCPLLNAFSRLAFIKRQKGSNPEKSPWRLPALCIFRQELKIPQKVVSNYSRRDSNPEPSDLSRHGRNLIS